MVFLSKRGGVPRMGKCVLDMKSLCQIQFSMTICLPVFRRPILKFNLSNVWAKPMAGASPNLPAGLTSRPMFI